MLLLSTAARPWKLGSPPGSVGLTKGKRASKDHSHSQPSRWGLRAWAGAPARALELGCSRQPPPQAALPDLPAGVDLPSLHNHAGQVLIKHIFLAVLHTLLVLFLCRALTGTDGAGPGGSGEGARARLLVQKLSLAAPQGAKALEETHVGRGLGSPAHSAPSEREPSPSAPQGPPE